MMEFYERVSGARMHAAYVRPGGVALVRLSTELFYWLQHLVAYYTVEALLMDTLVSGQL